MRKRSYGTRLGTGLAAAVLAIGPAAAPSLANTAKTWTVKPGGSFSGSSGRVTFTDTATGPPVTCSSSSISGKLKSGSGLSGSHIASITAFSFTSCVGPAGLHYTWTTGFFPYYLSADSYAAASGETTATVTGIVAALSGNGCNLVIAGTTDTTPGKVKGEYINSTQKFKIIGTGSTLQVFHPSVGCDGNGILWNPGDHVTISGTYTVTPKQAITSP